MRKYLSIILGIIVLILGIVFFKILNSEKESSKDIGIKSIVPTVDVKTVSLSAIPYVFEATGTLEAKEKIELYSEVQGLLQKTKTPFKIGNSFQHGQVLIRINSGEHQAQLKSSRSDLVNQIAIMLPDMEIDYPNAFKKWETYLKNLDVTNRIPELPNYNSIEEKLFISGKSIYKTYYSIKNLEERLDKYYITAPFSGIVTEANVDIGTLIRSGQKIGEIIDNSIFELRLAVPASENNYIIKGKSVSLTNVDKSKTFTGIITRINGKVDQETQTIQVIVEIREDGLKDGQYLNAKLEGKLLDNAYAIKNSLILEGNKIYTVEDNVLKLQDIEPVNYKGNATIVRGLKNGTVIVNQTFADAFPGMIVKISEQP